jgi:alkanesulfonate monooxygenase SsuD/methylene tetrahydromethanopterin reductase-like flavin-dependent oxidoreductase (luciferase family)
VALFGLRYDFRLPPFGKATHAELYQTALEQCEWADALGFATVSLSEHHGSPDGYLPSPMVFAAAVAARTKNLRVMLAALIVPLHDPIRLAEDLAVLDVLSQGRILPVISGGYVESEFKTFGRELSERREIMDGIVPLLEQCWSGEPFEHRGVTVRCQPRPFSQPRPPIFMGGASKAAARRAAKFADHFIPTVPELFELFREERKKLGKPDIGPLPRTTGNFLWVAEDKDAAWEVIAPHALHETNAYGEWVEATAGDDSPYEKVADADALRALGSYPIMTPDELIEEIRSMGPMDAVMLHPLLAGLDPTFSWECLRLIEEKVLPAVK